MNINFEKDLLDQPTEMPITPLIDVVFLLLIYFMVTSSLKKSEADLGITLPGTVQQSEPVKMPDEQIIEVQSDGTVLLNDTVYGADGEKELQGLLLKLMRFKDACDAAKVKALITIQADDKARHERVMDVMNVCAGARIRYVTFGKGAE